MKKFISLSCAIFIFASSLAQEKLYPAIKGFGSLWDVPAATIRADSTIDFKIVVEFRGAIPDAQVMHPYYEHLGRMYNLHIHDGVPADKLDVAIVIYGPAAFTVLSDDAYRAKYKTSNPNLKVFEEFSKVGIRTIVCGQSLTLLGIDTSAVTDHVSIASSRFTAVSTLQMKGYAVFQMQ